MKAFLSSISLFIGVVSGVVGADYYSARQGRLQSNIWGYEPNFVTLDRPANLEYTCQVPSFGGEQVPVYVTVRAEFSQVGASVPAHHIERARNMMWTFNDFGRYAQTKGWRCGRSDPHPDFVGDHKLAYVVIYDNGYEGGHVRVRVNANASSSVGIAVSPSRTSEQVDATIWGPLSEQLQEALATTRVRNLQ